MAHQSYDPIYLTLPPAVPDYYAAEDNKGHINTLFVSGLPDDVKAREIHNLFRRRPGFDNCQLKYTGRGNQVVAFATFFNHQSAIAAMHALNGVKFDPQSGHTLHIELARTNSRRKRKPGSGPYVVIDNRDKAASNPQEASENEEGGDSDESSDSEEHDSGDEGDQATTESAEAAGRDGTKASADLEKVNEGSGNACSTLFIANLGPNCTEDELKEVLSMYPGFNALKVRARGGMPVAFADFQEVEQATKAMEGLQETLLTSSDRGGMHIEYARSKMRKR